MNCTILFVTPRNSSYHPSVTPSSWSPSAALHNTHRLKLLFHLIRDFSFTSNININMTVVPSSTILPSAAHPDQRTLPLCGSRRTAPIWVSCPLFFSFSTYYYLYHLFRHLSFYLSIYHSIWHLSFYLTIHYSVCKAPWRPHLCRTLCSLSLSHFDLYSQRTPPNFK